MSPRLPGVKILSPSTTGPQYSRWRREVQSAFLAKGTWGHCDGTQPMPMPRAGPNFFSPSTASTPQPELLEERRTWVKKDRDVKMDIFLSVADEIKVEVFEVGPPLPPSAMTAKEMIEALDERFERFVFEDYHHVFCHFLNLHIDQFENIGAFNAEFKATLEDLLDFGHALTEVQACSAYLSKLRCTQNPWVATKLKEWNSLPAVPKVTDLMEECPPWLVVRPLSLKPSSRISVPDEDLMGPPSIQEEDEGDFSETERSESTASSASSRSASRPPSTQSLKRPGVSFPRRSSSLYSRPDICEALNTWSQADQALNPRLSRQSHELKVRSSSEDVVTLSAFPLPAKQHPKVPNDRINHRSSAPGLPKSTPAPVNRPLPPIPSESSTRIATPSLQSHANCSGHNPSATPEKTHAIRTQPTGSQSRTLRRPASSHTLFPPLNTTNLQASELQRRPSSQSSIPSTQQSPTSATSSSSDTPSNSSKSHTSWLLPARSMPLLNRHNSNDSSIISLPFQSTVGNHTNKPSNPAKNFRRASHTPGYFSSNSSRGFMSRLSAELNDDFDKRIKKRSWSLKARLSNRLEVKEII